MPVAEESDVNTVREEVFTVNLDANCSAESFDELRSRTRSFNSFWDNGCGALSCPSTLEASLSLMSGSPPKICPGISSK